jgi:hypothetical protein
MTTSQRVSLTTTDFTDIFQTLGVGVSQHYTLREDEVGLSRAAGFYSHVTPSPKPGPGRVF